MTVQVDDPPCASTASRPFHELGIAHGRSLAGVRDHRVHGSHLASASTLAGLRRTPDDLVPVAGRLTGPRGRLMSPERRCVGARRSALTPCSPARCPSPAGPTRGSRIRTAASLRSRRSTWGTTISSVSSTALSRASERRARGAWPCFGVSSRGGIPTPARSSSRLSPTLRERTGARASTTCRWIFRSGCLLRPTTIACASASPPPPISVTAWCPLRARRFRARRPASRRNLRLSSERCPPRGFAIPRGLSAGRGLTTTTMINPRAGARDARASGAKAHDPRREDAGRPRGAPAEADAASPGRRRTRCPRGGGFVPVNAARISGMIEAELSGRESAADLLAPDLDTLPSAPLSRSSLRRRSPSQPRRRRYLRPLRCPSLAPGSISRAFQRSQRRRGRRRDRRGDRPPPRRRREHLFPCGCATAEDALRAGRPRSSAIANAQGATGYAYLRRARAISIEGDASYDRGRGTAAAAACEKA